MHPCLLSICLATAVVAGPQPSGWTSFGVTDNTPYLSFYEGNRPRLTLGCSGTRTIVQLRGFTAAQAWPQPTLNLSFGKVARSSRPDLALVGNETAYSFDFPTSQKILTSLEAGEIITASYQRQVRFYPAIPELLRKRFVMNCAGLLPQGWAG